MIQSKPIRQIMLMLLIASTVSACGFHLRGNIPLPDGVKNLFLQAPRGDFKTQLEDVLSNAGAVLATNQGGADVILKITNASSDRTVGTLDARGKADSYNLNFKVAYSLLNQDGEVIRTASLKELRRYNFDPALIIESESEEAELLTAMEEAIALRIVRQLSTVTDTTPLSLKTAVSQ